MPRRVLVFLFAVLLLAMQQEAQWHALTHFGEWLQRPHEQALQLPQDDGPCAVCALFAGGSTAAPNDTAILAQPIVGFAAPLHAVSNAAAEAPSFYLSRAPPSLL